MAKEGIIKIFLKIISKESIEKEWWDLFCRKKILENLSVEIV